MIGQLKASRIVFDLPGNLDGLVQVLIAEKRQIVATSSSFGSSITFFCFQFRKSNQGLCNHITIYELLFLMINNFCHLLGYV
jgi:hypothetical protein